MSKRNSGEQKRENSQLKITFSVLIMVLSFLAELYTMIILKGNPIYLAGFGLVFLIFSYVLMNSVMQLQYQKLREEKEEKRLELYFHKRLMNDTLPLSIGGGIGQSRLCMFYLRKAHIGEIQASIWPEDMRKECEELEIHLI